MDSETAPLELAHYYPGWIWGRGSVAQMKSLLLFFDGFTLLLPDDHFRTTVAQEEELAAPLFDAGLLHNLEPRTWLDDNTAAAIREVANHTAALCRTLSEVPEIAPLVQSHFRTGYDGDLDQILRQMMRSGAVVRRRPDLGLDMVDMPAPVSEAVLLMVGLAARRLVRDHRIHLVGDLNHDDPWRRFPTRNAGAEPPLAPVRTPARATAIGQTIHRDIVDIGVDLSATPLDEILDFRRKNGKDFRQYAQGLRQFVAVLESAEPDEQQRLLQDRSEEIADIAADLRRSLRGWTRPVASIALAGAGAAWTFHQADPTGAIVAALGAIAGFTPPQRPTNAFTYLFRAQSRLW